MERSEVVRILRLLADGRDPASGEVLPDAGLLSRADVIRALFSAIENLEPKTKSQSRAGSASSYLGKRWRPEEDERLILKFKQGVSLHDLAVAHGRTPWAVEVRLLKLGMKLTDE